MQASSAVATPKAPADANEEDLIGLKKHNADLRVQMNEKEKARSQRRQLNQIAEMLRERKTVSAIVMKQKPVSTNAIVIKTKPISIDSTWAGSANECGNTDRGDIDFGVGSD